MNNGQSTVLDWHTPQGTSLGAPQWAALIAIANQGRVLYGEPTLSNVPAALYSLPSSDFNDITSGPANREGYSPGPGYDEITGLGTPNAKQLVADSRQPATFPSAVDLADCADLAEFRRGLQRLHVHATSPSHAGEPGDVSS